MPHTRMIKIGELRDFGLVGSSIDFVSDDYIFSWSYPGEVYKAIRSNLNIEKYAPVDLELFVRVKKIKDTKYDNNIK